MVITILGGGLSAISLAYFLQSRPDVEKIVILEKESQLGGLCRSFERKGIVYDVGPHIIFSKDKEILDFMNKVLGSNISFLRRSNRILHKGIFVQYPFENDLSKLPESDKKFCVNAFVHNPYENYEASNMLQFFLKTFGSGITDIYLRPYNEKIWKYDPSFMDIQMVERIPKPPKDDILRSANGETVDGYTHQLYFSYPKVGGTESLIKGLTSMLSDKVKIYTRTEVVSVSKEGNKYVISSPSSVFSSDRLVSTIPVNELVSNWNGFVPAYVNEAAQDLKFNSIAIAIVNVKPDLAHDNFAFMIADKKVIFHRLSKLDFLGKNYHLPSSTSYMLEVTYRENDLVDKMTDTELVESVVSGLMKINFINSSDDVIFTDVKRFKYAYVIYDLNHRHNMNIITNFFNQQGVYLNGRFGTFEYLNMDAVIRQSKILAANIS